MQSAIHTQTGGAYGSGKCDRNGCYARVGGPQAPFNFQVCDRDSALTPPRFTPLCPLLCSHLTT